MQTGQPCCCTAVLGVPVQQYLDIIKGKNRKRHRSKKKAGSAEVGSAKAGEEGRSNGAQKKAGPAADASGELQGSWQSRAASPMDAQSR